MWKLWGNLPDAVREGTHRWTQTYGLDGPIFSHFFRDEAAKREFLMGMHGYGLISSPQVVAAFDLSRFRKLIDLGGATGHLAIAACQRYPDMRAAVFDLPEALPLAREIVGASAVLDRIELVAGDFFADALPGRPDCGGSHPARLVGAKDPQAVGQDFRALPAGGALLIAEKLLDEDKKGPRHRRKCKAQHAYLLRRKERTLSEYETLLKKAGFAGFQAAERSLRWMRCWRLNELISQRYLSTRLSMPETDRNAGKAT